jgi:hypothetical protein
MDGQLIRETKLQLSVKRTLQCSFSLSLDKLAVVKHEDGVFHLSVYQLQRRDQIQEMRMKREMEKELQLIINDHQ